MAYVEFGDILFTLAVSAAVGAAAAAFYILLRTFIYTLDRFVFLPKKVLTCSKDFSSLKAIKNSTVPTSGRSMGISVFVTDFIFAITYGIALIFLLYATCDGVFRLYPLIASLAALIITKKFLADKLEAVIKRLIGFICLCIEAMLAALLFALRRCSCAVLRITSPVFGNMMRRVRVKKSKK